MNFVSQLELKNLIDYFGRFSGPPQMVKVTEVLKEYLDLLVSVESEEIEQP